MRTSIDRRTLVPALAAFFVLVAAAPGCSGSADIKEWQAAAAKPRPPAERGGLEDEIARVESLRKGLDLGASRGLALTLAVEHPGEPRVLHLASRAESDELCLLDGQAGAERDLAALSALDYAERAAEAGAATADSLAQLAWARGTTTHLKSMFSRAGHAQRTLEAVESALAIDPEHPRALATLSVLRLRLATLPWIARAMAWGAPEGSIEEAVSAAERSVAREPSIEYRLQLARALSAAEKKDNAASILRQALAAPDAFPRDRELRPKARELLDSLEDVGS
jgi:tetratricopeptide (TPR) repeat protein